jgi:arsenate reductase
MTAILYGFKGCDTVRNAMQWLDANGIDFEFFDYRRIVLDHNVVDEWFARAGWEKIFNRRSTTFRQLPEDEKIGIDANRAKQMILAETNFIKRPILDTGYALLVGFKASEWANAIGSHSETR